jgi:putative transposase
VTQLTDESGRFTRRSIRLKGYDYSQAGAYFVTLAVQNRDCILGEIKNSNVILSDVGRITAASWEWLASQYPYVELSEWIVMPNHLHGILVIHPDGGENSAAGIDGSGPCWGGSRTAPTRSAPTKPLGGLIGAFKTVSTKKWNVMNHTPGAVLWQRNYYEHIIRNDQEWESISRYIIANPINWVKDENFPQG